MATHDYVIDNQTAPNFRADLNNALLAIVSNNSNATQPAVIYANMMWYDTAENILYMRNEDNDDWIALGTLNQTADTFAASVALASQAEAEAGTDNTKVMTPLRVKQSVVANVPPQAPALQGNAVVSRSVNVTLTNSLTRPILVFAGYQTTDNQARSIQGQVNYGAGLINTATATNGATTGESVSIVFVVPAGSQYRVNMPSTANTNQTVVEFN